MVAKIRMKDLEKVDIKDISERMGNPLEREISEVYIKQIVSQSSENFYQIFVNPNELEIINQIKKYTGNAADLDILSYSLGGLSSRMKSLMESGVLAHICIVKQKIPFTLEALVKDLVKSISNSIEIPFGNCLRGVNLYNKYAGIFLSSSKKIYLGEKEEIIGLEQNNIDVNVYPLETSTGREKLHSRKLVEAYFLNIKQLAEEK